MKQGFNIDLVAEGTRLGNDLLTGLQSIGQAIKDWFIGLFQLPEWVQNLGFGPTDPKVVPGAPVTGTGEAVPARPETPIKFDQDAWDAKMELQRQEWENMLKNANDNIQKMAPDTAVDATITDARADNRSFPQTNNVTVNQTVTQATDAPKQAAQATAGAVQGAVAQQRSQIETEPSF